MELTNRLLDLTTNDAGTPINELTIATSPKIEDLSLVGPAHMQENNSYPHIEDNCPKFDAALSRIYRYTPLPTLVLDEGLCVAEVSDSHCAFSGQSRDALIGTCACDIPVNSIPAPDTATLYGALRAAISSKEIQVIENIHIKNQRLCYQLQVTPILEGSSLMYVVLEAHDITKDHWGNE
jgi:osomolarity two-component system sensor histidine kinase TcsA